MNAVQGLSADRKSSSVRVEIHDLVKQYSRLGGSKITPVDHIDLQVASDELVVLLGPSGCGKTTLLRCVAGLERPDHGEIRIGDEVVFSSARGIFVPPNHRRISMIFQSFALWPHMTVFANVAYPLETRGLTGGEVRQRVLAVLEMVGISGLEEQYPGRISGGQQQRVALARALVAGSNLVLFDEPLSNVDAQVRAQLRFELKRMQQQIGFSALYVTHDQTEAMELGHRVAVLDRGKVAALGAPRSVYERPPNDYVANFVGMANIIAGTVTASEGQTVEVATAIGRLVAGGLEGSAAGAGEAVSVVVRPEAIRLAAEPVTAGPNQLKVTLETRMFAGPHTEYVVRTNSETLRVWVTDDKPLSGLKDGGTLWLSIEPERVWLVPRDNAGGSPKLAK